MLLAAAGAQAQTEQKVRGDTIFYHTMPSFLGGDINNFGRWLSEHGVYPQELIDQGIEGKVIVSCIVETDGSLTVSKVVSSPHQSLSYAALQILTSAPKWEPGLNGPVVLKDGTVIREAKAARVHIMIPVVFGDPSKSNEKKRTFTGPLYPYNEINSPPAFLEESDMTPEEWITERAAASKRLQKAGPRTIMLLLVVEPDSSLSVMRIMNSPDKAATKELTRILDDMPALTPGVHGGKVVRTQMTIRIDIGTGK